MIPASWNWRPYLALAQQAGSRYGVDPAVILAVIAIESRFDPDAIRGEPHLNDSSYGLMQLLGTTARGLGYTGAPAGLFDPARNIDLGARLVADILAARRGDVAKMFSEYNGGYRPSLGFGEPATKPITGLCLARNAKGECIKAVNVPVGRFGNQDHVDRGLAAWADFRKALGGGSSASSAGGGAVLLLALVALAWWAGR